MQTAFGLPALLAKRWAERRRAEAGDNAVDRDPTHADARAEAVRGSQVEAALDVGDGS